jgi:hypothetical protein
MLTLNDYIIRVAEHNLINYVEDFKKEEANYYDSEEYEIHLTYLIETWKNLIDEHFVKIDYDRQGTFEELYNYFVEAVDAPFPNFNNEWLDDIFERHILVTNVCLK